MTHEHIEKVETWNSGGNIMLDIVHLKSGQVLVIDECYVAMHRSLESFLVGGSIEEDGHIIELF